MRITRVSADNWRNFTSVSFPIDRRLFIVGPNAAGKSNLLDLFRFLGDIAAPGGGLSSAVSRRGGISKVRSLFSRNHRNGRLIIDLDLEDGDDKWHYRLSIKGESGGHNRPIVDAEIVDRNGKRILQRPDKNDHADSELLTQTHIEQISANQRFRKVVEHLAKAQYFHLVPQIIRDPSRASTVGRDPFGGSFISEMNGTPKRTRDAWMKRIQTALQSAVPEFETLEIEVDPSGTPHLKAGYRNWRSNPSAQRETEFSDGTLRLIGLLWTVIKAPTGSGILLLEEPELSLNSAIVKTIPSVLATAQRSSDLQVLLSTHAPEILDDEEIRPEEVLVLRVTGNGTQADLLSTIDAAAHDLESGVWSPSDVVNRLISPGDLSGLLQASRSR